MDIDSDKLEEWAAAERFAVMAEETVRTAMKLHLEGLGEAPSEETQRIARERRAEADKLFHALRARTQGPKGAPST